MTTLSNRRVKPGTVFAPGRFGPSRSAVMSTRGMVATSQPLAALEGVRVLEQGGSAADAAIATAAVLNVIEPMSTGVGGDLFALIYDTTKGATVGLNSSGRAPAAASLEEYRRRLAGEGEKEIPPDSPLAWTVPGTVDGWATVLENWGHMKLANVLLPAIRIAENGFAVAPHTAAVWEQARPQLTRRPDSARTWLFPDGHAPRPGEVFRNPRLARTLRAIAEGGREVFYRGEFAEAITRFSERHEGLFAREDFSAHTSSIEQPLSCRYRDCEVLEFPPNSQGVAALEALAILEGEDLGAMEHLSTRALHLQIESMKLALHDAWGSVTDPGCCKVPASALLAGEYVKKQRARISAQRAAGQPGLGVEAGDTVAVCAVDREGNAVSLLNTVFMPWGSGLTVEDTGILLQNRGFCFSMDTENVNVIAPRKRTRHTLAPAMALHQGKPLLVFAFVGGDMQVQAHVQFLSNVMDFGMNLQDALDAPRWRYDGAGAGTALEAGVAGKTQAELAGRGHQISGSGGFFGGGQAILIGRELESYQGASDGRRDGCALGY